MNFREKIIQQNIARCEARSAMLTAIENKFVERMKRLGVCNEVDFNALARIADDGERRKNNQSAVPEHAEKCPKCGAMILWVSSQRGKKVLIDARTFHSEPYFNPSKHACHWDMCDFKCP